VGHKKRATLFWTITPAFLDGFQQFVLVHQKNRKKYSIGNYKICNVATTVSLHYLRKFKNTQNSTTMGNRFLPYVRSNQSCTTFTESRLAFIVSSSC